MTYLIMQMLICLLIAFILGVLVGWLLCKMCCGSGKKCSHPSHKQDDDGEDDGETLTPKTKQSISSKDKEIATAVAAMESMDDSAVIDLDTAVNLDDVKRYSIQTLEGVGPATGDIFRGYGIKTVGDYLRKLHSPSQRKQAAKDLNILIKPLDDWAAMADLMRIEGIDHQYAELAHAAGIYAVSDLAHANPATLAQSMDEVNRAGKQLIAPNAPTAEEVAEWAGRAQSMARVVTY